MIERLRGTLIYKDTQGAVIDCGGVGYGVSMSLHALSNLGADNTIVSVLIYTHVSEDTLRLFGFLDALERQTFDILLHTTGVGPKLALTILSTVSPQALVQLVADGDKTSLTRIPGIGTKKAERLLLELKDKLKAVHSSAMPSGTSLLHDLHGALLHLGFNQSIADAAAQAALRQAPQETDLSTLMRFALRATTQTTLG